MVAAVLSGATETKQRFTLGPYHDGTLDKNTPHPTGEEIEREWNNKLIVYKYRLIRLARLGIRQYKLKTKATNIHNSEVYRQVVQQNQVLIDLTRSDKVCGHNEEVVIGPTGASRGAAGLAGIFSESGALQEPSGTKWNH